MSFFESDKGRALVDAVRRAGDVLLSFWPGAQASEHASVTQKSDGSFVSTADLQSNALLSDALRTLFPDEYIFSEEVEDAPERVAAAECVWIIDPLDGTSAFLQGRDDFSILVARCSGKRPTEGIVYFPARGILALGCEGEGAYVNGLALRVSTHERCAPKSVYIRNFTALETDLASPMMDSGLALYKVAAGELDGAIIKMTTHREWDIAAPIRLIQEAGGCVTDEAGRPIPVGLGRIAFGYLVASNGRVHEQLKGLIPENEKELP